MTLVLNKANGKRRQKQICRIMPDADVILWRCDGHTTGVCNPSVPMNKIHRNISPSNGEETNGACKWSFPSPFKRHVGQAELGKVEVGSGTPSQLVENKCTKFEIPAEQNFTRKSPKNRHTVKQYLDNSSYSSLESGVVGYSQIINSMLSHKQKICHPELACLPAGRSKGDIASISVFDMLRLTCQNFIMSLYRIGN